MVAATLVLHGGFIRPAAPPSMEEGPLKPPPLHLSRLGATQENRYAQS